MIPCKNKLNIEDWFSHISTLHKTEMELGLARVRKVAIHMQLIPIKKTVITVAGTNGKGTCLAVLNALLLSAGYNTALYTSPHLLRINERFLFAGVEVENDDLCQAFAAVEVGRAEVSLTFFEFCLLAFLWLANQKQVDVVLLEVGLGGRLDAVNIIDADVAVITSIALDHQAILGNTREQIGFEKAGIFRTNKSAIYGGEDIPSSIKKHADRVGAKLYCQGYDFDYKVFANYWQFQQASEVINDLPIPSIPTQNAATAIMALKKSDLVINWQELSLATVLSKVAVAGRMQRFVLGCEVIVDVAHNPHAAKYLSKYLTDNPISGKNIIVFSGLADKDLRGIVDIIKQNSTDWNYAKLNCERAATIDFLASILPSSSICYNSILHALQQVVAKSSCFDRAVVFGSFYVVSEVLPWLKAQKYC